MKKFVVTICIVCFLSWVSLVQAAEIIKTPLNYKTLNGLTVEESELLARVNFDEVQAGGAGKVFAAIGIGVGTGLLIYALLSTSSSDNDY
jgi:hypothetical protein